MSNFVSRIFYKYKSFWLTLIVLLSALLPRITTLGGTFIVNDEPLYWQWSNDFLAALVNADWYGTFIGKGYPSVTVMWVHNLGLAVYYLLDLLSGYSPVDFWQRAALDQPLVFDLLGQRRLVMGLTNALLIVVIYRQAKKLTGQAIAFWGTILMAFAPFLLADARTMRGDALMSSLMLISVLALLLYLRDGQWRQLIFSAVVMGLALLDKITAIPVVGFAGLAVGIYVLHRRDWTWPARLRWGTGILALWAGVTALTVFALWPALWVAPWEVFTFIRDYAASSIDGRLNYFWGELTHDRPLPLFYPNAFLFRATPLTVLGVVVIAGLVLTTIWRFLKTAVEQQLSKSTALTAKFSSVITFILAQIKVGRSSSLVRSLDELWSMPASTRWTLFALGAYSVIYWLVLNQGALKRDRYLMPIFPAVMFIAAAGLLWLIERLGRRWPGQNLPSFLSGGRWAWAIFGLLFALELGHVLSTHPFYYTYWSPLTGGGQVAMEVMMAEGGVDSAALVHLDQRPNAEEETVALLTSRDYAPAFSGKTVRLIHTDPWVTAEHVMLRQYHYQTEKMDPHLLEYLFRNPPEHVVEYQGYTWAWVYPGPSAQYYSGSLLDGKARLLGYNLSAEQAAPDQPLQVKLFWKNKGLQPSEEIFVRLVDAGGFIWAGMTAQVLPDFVPVAHRPEAIVESEATLQIPPGTPPGVYFLKMGVTAAGEPDAGEFVLSTNGDEIRIERPARPLAYTPPQPVDHKLSADLTLVGTDLSSPMLLTPRSPQTLTLYWRAEAAISDDYIVAVRLLGETGREAAYWLGHPTRGLYPSSNWQQGDLIRDPWTLDLTTAEQPRPLKPGRYTLNIGLFKANTEQETGQITLGEIDVAERQYLFEAPPLEHTVEARLGEDIMLLGYELEQAPLTGGARFTVELYWQALAKIPADYTVFVQVLGPDGTVVGQHDGVPANGEISTTEWLVGEIIPDRHRIDFPLTQQGDYRLIVGMYDPETGTRLPITDSTGVLLGDFLLLRTLTITGTE